MKTNLVTWTKYVGEFKKYMAAWDEYNAQFLAHFNARKETLNAVWMATQYSPLDAVGNSALRDYQEALRFDREVRAKWTLACDEHEKRVQEFMGFKNRMAA